MVKPTAPPQLSCLFPFEMHLVVLKVKSGKHVPLKTFCSGLVYQIFERYGTPTSVLHGRALSRPDLPDRLRGRDYIGRHHLITIPPPAIQEGETRKNRTRAQRQCIVCAHT
ncbi:hypothetical protein Pmani_007048 [Petrolisthes manimaculis]|uniref:Uncharacterized protein n=1 Tax=Petrolisthes manimaculis TaxID=1843537 RepID=A0AAE1QBG8_9EUCA|nr:hypothetical protein Pmani_007048 [Petrolisthes manimaculis]